MKELWVCLESNWTLTGVGPKVGEIVTPGKIHVDGDGKQYAELEEYTKYPDHFFAYRTKFFVPLDNIGADDLREKETVPEEGKVCAL